MVSLSAPGVMVTCPRAFGRQAEMAEDDGLSPNENDVAGAEGAPESAKAPDEAARPPPASIATAERWHPSWRQLVAGIRRIANRMLVMVLAS